MPAIVFIFGILSILLLLWVARVSERLQIDASLIDAITDVQVRTATYHLRLEETLAGIASADEQEALSSLDQAIKLVDLTLNGGVAEYGQLLDPLEDPELRARAEEINDLLGQLKIIGLKRLQGVEEPGADLLLEPRFEAAFKKILGRTKDLEDILEQDQAGNQKKSGRLFLSILLVWVLLLAVATASLWRRERQRNSAEGKLLQANKQLLLQKEELTEHRENLAGQVESRTAELLAANERVRVEMTERLQTCESLQKTEKQIQHLSAKLLKAQEVERKRISLELHDELGQALNVMKLQIRVMERGLQPGQEALRDDCEKLREYIDQVIEDVRRLSLDLSPTVLDDLGLTAALRWLISNLKKIPDLEITADIAEIDHLFPKNNWITIYRIIQEALTNITKHARAKRVAIVIRPHDQRVAFAIEDDGAGFDPEQVMMKEAAAKGFGLRTLNERVGIMGGTLDLWSHQGEGTRIIFNLPSEKGGV